jgi:hypothetical protein
MEEKKKLLITIAVTAVLVLAFLGGVIYQMRSLGVSPLDHPASLRGQIRSLHKQSQQLEQRVKVELPAKRAERDSLLGMKELAAELLPRRIATEQINRFVREKADLALVAVTDFELSQPRRQRGAAGGPAEEWEVDLELYGTYDQVALFVNYMENFELRGANVGAEGQDNVVHRFFAVKSMNLIAQEEGMSTGGTHNVNLVLSTYRFSGGAGGPAGSF